MNGSGKTGAFCVPAIMHVDPTILALQVLIIGGATRELNRQTKQILEVLVKDLGVTVCFGEKAEKFNTSHIMVTTMGYIKQQLNLRGSNFSLKNVNFIVFDEADEIFN